VSAHITCIEASCGGGVYVSRDEHGTTSLSLVRRDEYAGVELNDDQVKALCALLTPEGGAA
jgi:hypothetical protein